MKQLSVICLAVCHLISDCEGVHSSVACKLLSTSKLTLDCSTTSTPAWKAS